MVTREICGLVACTRLALDPRNMLATPMTADDGDQDRQGAPERELAPHAAAIDDMVGIERHVGSP